MFSRDKLAVGLGATVAVVAGGVFAATSFRESANPGSASPQSIALGDSPPLPDLNLFIEPNATERTSASVTEVTPAAKTEESVNIAQSLLELKVVSSDGVDLISTARIAFAGSKGVSLFQVDPTEYHNPTGAYLPVPNDVLEEAGISLETSSAVTLHVKVADYMQYMQEFVLYPDQTKQILVNIPRAGVLHGTVIDGISKLPIEGAEIGSMMIERGELWGRSDSDGRFTNLQGDLGFTVLDPMEGTMVLRVLAPGYTMYDRWFEYPVPQPIIAELWPEQDFALTLIEEKSGKVVNPQGTVVEIINATSGTDDPKVTINQEGNGIIVQDVSFVDNPGMIVRHPNYPAVLVPGSKLVPVDDDNTENRVLLREPRELCRIRLLDLTTEQPVDIYMISLFVEYRGLNGEADAKTPPRRDTVRFEGERLREVERGLFSVSDADLMPPDLLSISVYQVFAGKLLEGNLNEQWITIDGVEQTERPIIWDISRDGDNVPTYTFHLTPKKRGF